MPVDKVQEFPSGGEAYQAMLALAKAAGCPVAADAAEAMGVLAPILMRHKVEGTVGVFDLYAAVGEYNQKPVPSPPRGLHRHVAAACVCVLGWFACSACTTAPRNPLVPPARRIPGARRRAASRGCLLLARC